MSTDSGSTTKIYPNVDMGADARIGDFSIIGHPLGNGDQPATKIGAGAVVRSHTVIYAGNAIGDKFQTGHGVLIREDNTIGDNVSVGSHSVIEHHVSIADGVRIHSQVFVPEYSVLEDGAWLGPKVCVTNAPYPAAPRTKEFLKGVRIGKNARIGANVTILPGVVIGAEALVGAGSVVTRDVEPGRVVVGNPNRQVGRVEDLLYGPEGDNERVYPPRT